MITYEKALSPKVVSHCGVVAADETWDESSVHVVTCSLRVARAVTLTVAPGTVVKQNDSSPIDVLGTLTAPGTTTKPVIFTSINDDTYGGDTNSNLGNEDPTTRSATIQLGISNRGFNDPDAGITPTLNLTHTTIRYGGIASSTDANVTIADSTLSPSTGINLYGENYPAIPQGPVAVTITSTTITVPTGNFTYSDYAAIHIDHKVPATDVITGNTLSAPTAKPGKDIIGGINLANPSDTSPTPVVRDNTTTHTTGPAVRITAQHLHGDQLTGNTGTANAINTLALGGIIDADTTLPLTGSNLTPATVGPLRVARAVTLTVAPGTVVKQNDSSPIDVLGTLTAPGTTTKPVIFTSINDDTYGGDTNSNLGNEDPTTRSATIRVTTEDDQEPPASANLSHTSIRYGGISLSKGSAGIFDSIVVDHSVVALEINGDSTVLSSKISDSKGVYVGNDASLTIDADFSEVETVLTVGSGSALLKGRLLDKKRLDDSRSAVSTCPWYQKSCGIDATGFDWGDGASPLGGTPPLACGAVNIDRKYLSLPERLTNPWPVPGCNEEQFKPVDDWVEHASQAEILVDAKRRACEDARSREQAQNPDLTIGYACDQVEQYAKCMVGILDVASEFYGAPKDLSLAGVTKFLTEGIVDLLLDPKVLAQLDPRLEKPGIARQYIGKILKYAAVGKLRFSHQSDR